MSTCELAQLNIGIIKGPMDSPVMAEFAANLDRINALAERSPGFVWRLRTERGINQVLTKRLRGSSFYEHRARVRKRSRSARHFRLLTHGKLSRP